MHIGGHGGWDQWELQSNRSLRFCYAGSITGRLTLMGLLYSMTRFAQTTRRMKWQKRCHPFKLHSRDIILIFTHLKNPFILIMQIRTKTCTSFYHLLKKLFLFPFFLFSKIDFLCHKEEQRFSQINLQPPTSIFSF